MRTWIRVGVLIGQRFSDTIKKKLEQDLLLKNHLLPFTKTPESEPIMEAFCQNNKAKYPTYWEEMVGIAEGSGVPILEIILINLKREIIPSLEDPESILRCVDDCTDIHVVSDSMAIGAHNEDVFFAMAGHDYLLKVKLHDGLSFIAYTHAGELPTRAFGFNSNGVAFTMNLVRPLLDEVDTGAIGRAFVARDLLESTSLEDAIARIRSAEVCLGHNYNLMGMKERRIVNIETASRSRFSLEEVGAKPFFHANLYTRLEVKEAKDEHSANRHKRAEVLPKESKDDFLSVLGDADNEKFSIYCTGPQLYTACTALFDLDEQTLSIYRGNPKNKEIFQCISLTELQEQP